jgi:hypothetical protein
VFDFLSGLNADGPGSAPAGITTGDLIGVGSKDVVGGFSFVSIGLILAAGMASSVKVEGGD